MATISELPPLSDDAARLLFTAYETEVEDPYAVKDNSGSLRYLRTSIYGEPGCGKTVLAARLALPEEKTYFVDCENSTEVLVSHPEFKGKVKRGKFYGFIETTYLIERIIRDDVYKTLVIDSITSAIDIEMLSILKNSGFTRANTAGGQQSFTEQDYGLLLNRLKWFLSYASQAPLNIVLTGHVKEPTEKELVNGQKRRLVGSDNQVITIAREMGNLFFMEEVVNEGKRFRAVRTRTDGKVQAKCRINEMPDYLLDDKFIAAIHKWRRGEPI